MPRRLAAVALTLAAAGCSRDLSVPPPPSVEKLGIVPVFQAAAPRQSVQFAASGGAPGYTFAFAQGGQLSGADASIDPDGLYTAGSLGSAQDVIQVTDAAGSVAAATVSVGQRLGVAPSFTGTAPGGRITFDASGGQPDYVFAFIQNTSGGAITADGHYQAGSVGDQVDTLVVTDRYGATAMAAVQVSSALHLYRSDTRPVAPHESVTFIAFGGQPPYTYSIDPGAGSGDPTIDPASGAYVAGSRLDDPSSTVTTDVVRVRDSASVPQTATLPVPVGPRLSLSLASSDIHPGQPVLLVASGGKPPYTFGFAARVPLLQQPLRDAGGNGGNRSRGSVDAFSGEYVPGFSPGAIDFLQVTDATGAPAAVVEGPAVGGVPYAIGSGVQSCVAGDFNGDHSQDVAFAIDGDNIHKLTVAELLDTPEPFLQSYFIQPDPSAASVVADFTGAGRDRIAFFGGDRNCSGGGAFCPAWDLWEMVPDLAGLMSVGQAFGGGTTEATSAGIRTGAARYDPSSAAWSLYTDGNRSLDPVSGGYVYCPGTNEIDRAVVRLDWPAFDPEPSSTCLVVQGFCPDCGPYPEGPYYSQIAFAVGDYDGNGSTDIAWILSTDPTGSTRVATGTNAKVFISYGNGSGTFPSPRSGWPGASWTFEVPRSSSQTRFMTVHAPPGSGISDALAIRLVDAAGRPQLFVLRDPAGAWSAPFDPSPGSGGVDGFASYVPAPGAEPSYVSWSGSDGVVTGFGITLDATSVAFGAPSTVATMPFAVNAVCLPDVNADGTPDLVAASDNGGTAQLLIGDGTVGGALTGTFASHAHLRGGSFPVAVGDLDGDGYGDAIVSGGGSGLFVLWGGGGMFAWGPQISSASIGAAAVADFTGDGWPSVLYQEKSGRFARIRSHGDGTFDPAVAVTGYSAGGGTPGVYFYVWPADLGTSAPGVDLLTFGNKGSSSIHALLVQGGRIVDVGSKDFPRFDGDHPSPRDCWALPVGVGLPSVVAACSYDQQNGVTSSAVAFFGATISNQNSGPPDPVEPAFSDWVLLTSTTVEPSNPFTLPSPTRARVGHVGNIQDPYLVPGMAPGTALFLVGTDKLYAVEVTTDGSTWTVTKAPDGKDAFAVAPDTVAMPFLSTYGNMEPTEGFNVVTSGDQGTVVLKRDAAGYHLVQQTSSRAFPLGIAPLAPNSQGDVITFNGDFSNTGLTPEIVPLLNLNDGTGRLR